MNMRKMGNTGIELSALGFGCMRLPVKEDGAIDEQEAIRIIRDAIDNGLNYVDTAYYYHDQQSEVLVGKALQDGYREKVYLATKQPEYNIEKEEDFDNFLHTQLTRLQTDHIDFYLLHALNRRTWEEKVIPFHVLEKLKKAKEDGLVRHIGFSFHDDFDTFKMILDSFDGWEFCQIQMNYIDIENQATLKGLEYAASKGLGVVIMEPLLGGKLANLSPQVKEKLDPSKTPVEWALDFLWNRPEVSVILSGMGSEQMVKDNMLYAGRSSIGMLSQKDLDMLMQAREVYQTRALVPCTGCAYCMPCPFGLDIPGIYEVYNQTVNRSREDALAAYEALEVKADACKKCRRCEKACPQKISPLETMPQIDEYFANLREQLKK